MVTCWYSLISYIQELAKIVYSEEYLLMKYNDKNKYIDSDCYKYIEYQNSRNTPPPCKRIKKQKNELYN